MDKYKNEDIESTDYDNLVVVGIWLIAKENGSMLHSLIEWLQFPTSTEDTSKLTSAAEIFSLGETFLDMMFSFKH